MCGVCSLGARLPVLLVATKVVFVVSFLVMRLVYWAVRLVPYLSELISIIQLGPAFVHSYFASKLKEWLQSIIL